MRCPYLDLNFEDSIALLGKHGAEHFNAEKKVALFIRHFQGCGQEKDIKLLKDRLILSEAMGLHWFKMLREEEEREWEELPAEEQNARLWYAEYLLSRDLKLGPIFKEETEIKGAAAFLCMDDIVVVPYHPDAYWEEYQQDQTFEKMTRWLKHRAWYLWMEGEARRIVSHQDDMRMAMLPMAKREMLDEFSQGLVDAARRADRGCH